MEEFILLERSPIGSWSIALPLREVWPRGPAGKDGRSHLPDHNIAPGGSGLPYGWKSNWRPFGHGTEAELAAIYHSHPKSPASFPKDIELAFTCLLPDRIVNPPVMRILYPRD